MKQKSKILLSELCATNTKASLVALWTDLSALTREQFVSELDGIIGGKRAPASKPKKVAKPSRKFAKDDRPVTRIAFILTEDKNLSVEDAKRKLSDALQDRGYVSDVPSSENISMEEWLEKLLIHVPSSEVMDAAKKIV